MTLLLESSIINTYQRSKVFFDLKISMGEMNMKKNKKYPNVTFSQWKNNEGGLSLILFINGSDVYNFDTQL